LAQRKTISAHLGSADAWLVSDEQAFRQSVKKPQPFFLDDGLETALFDFWGCQRVARRSSQPL